MDEFAYFNGTDVAMLILLLMLWVFAVIAIDRWVSAGRSGLPPDGSSKLRRAARQ